MERLIPCGNTGLLLFRHFFHLAGGILTVVLIIMEALFGLQMPAMRSQIETQVYWRWIGLISSGRRNAIAENLRAAQITEIIIRYTEDIVVEMTPLSRLRNFVQSGYNHISINVAYEAVRKLNRRGLEDMGFP